MTVFIRTAFNHDSGRVTRGIAARRERGVCRAIQSAKEECDINTIVKRFGLTGIPQNVPLPPLQGDFSAAGDFKDCMDLQREATETFASMSAVVRERFANKPERFVAFCSERTDDGKLTNLDEMRKFGLALPEAPAPVPPEPMRVHVVSSDVDSGSAAKP